MSSPQHGPRGAQRGRRTPHARRAPRVPFALLVTALIVGGLGLLLALNTASAANELRRHDLATQDLRVANEVQALRNEVAVSAAPGNLARAAAQLGMVPGGNPAFIVVGADGRVTVLGRPRAVQDVPVAIAPQPTTPHEAPAATTASAKPSSTPSSKPGSKPGSTSASKSGSTSASRTGAKPSSTAASSARRSPSPKPPSTPTPTLTLPGGTR